MDFDSSPTEIFEIDFTAIAIDRGIGKARGRISGTITLDVSVAAIAALDAGDESGEADDVRFLEADGHISDLIRDALRLPPFMELDFWAVL